jgi:hypothetical protein
LKRKGTEKKMEWRVATEDAEEELMAPLELLDGVMEQVEAMAKELRKIRGGIWALVEGVGKLMEAVEGMGKKEVVKVDKETGTEDVQRVDKQTEMDKEVEDSEEDEESEEEEEDKGDDGKEDKGESDGMEDREEEGGR